MSRCGRAFFLCLALMLIIRSTGFAAEDYLTKDKLTKKDVYSYIDNMVSKSGGRLLTVHRVVNQEGKAIVFFRYHNRYGPTTNEQLLLVKEQESGRWYDEKRREYLMEGGSSETSK